MTLTMVSTPVVRASVPASLTELVRQSSVTTGTSRRIPARRSPRAMPKQLATRPGRGTQPSKPIANPVSVLSAVRKPQPAWQSSEVLTGLVMLAFVLVVVVGYGMLAFQFINFLANEPADPAATGELIQQAIKIAQL